MVLWGIPPLGAHVPQILKGVKIMQNYTQGAVLSSATTLPVTAATAVAFLNHANTGVLVGLLAVNAVSVMLTVAMVSRYMRNRRS